MEAQLEQFFSPGLTLCWRGYKGKQAPFYFPSTTKDERILRQLLQELSLPHQNAWVQITAEQCDAIVGAAGRHDLSVVFIGGPAAGEEEPAADDQDKDAELCIVAAAIRDDTGKIWTLPPPARHHTIINWMRQSGYTGGTFGHNGEQQGFMLSNGNYCRRRPAFFVAEKAGQIKNGKLIGAVLTSEDLW